MTQGSPDCIGTTLGFEAESRWDSMNRVISPEKKMLDNPLCQAQSRIQERRLAAKPNKLCVRFSFFFVMLVTGFTFLAQSMS
jgi:hypothetical protein